MPIDRTKFKNALIALGVSTIIIVGFVLPKLLVNKISYTEPPEEDINLPSDLGVLAGPTPEIVITDKILTLQNAETVCETTEKEVCEMVDSEEVCKMVSEEVCEDIPEKKDVQVNFTYGEKEGSITVNFDGFNRCRAEGKTKTKCLALLKDQIQKNIQWWKEGVDARAAEEQIGDFSSELKPTDF